MVELSEPSVNPKRRLWPRRLLLGVLLLSGLTLGFLGYIGVLDSNLREVSRGKLYRSAQLKPAGFKAIIESQGIKSVLNLRGERKGEEWYRAEIAVCEEANVEHVDLNIGLGELPRPEVLQALVAKLEAGPYPMLIHCRSGSDRTGLGSAFYVHFVEKMPLEQAEAEQVTWRYGHFGIGRAKSINDFFELYHASSNGKDLKAWLYDDYSRLYNERVTSKDKVRSDD